MKTNAQEPPVGYSAYCAVQQCFEYNENHCYVADSLESLREFMDGCMVPGQRYRPVPVTMSDILADYGVSGGAYCFETEALGRFESTARDRRVEYTKEPFDPGLMNVDVRVTDYGDQEPPPSAAAALADSLDGPMPFVPVTFSGHERPFAIHLLRCLNPQSLGGEMLLWFNEIPPKKSLRFRGMSFLIDIDSDAWYERSVPQRSDRIADFVAEFLREVTPEMKREFARQQQSLPRLEREPAGSTMPFPDCPGGLLSFSDFLDHTGPVAYTFRFVSEECQYLIEDFYCSNPDCECDAVNLNFVACQLASHAVRFEERFVAHVPFAPTDRIRITQTCGKRKREALRIATSWCADNRGSLDLFRTRYAAIKEFGRRMTMLEETDDRDAPQPPESMPRKQAKVGRNQPCPCGSGKKYKKCCGKA